MPEPIKPRWACRRCGRFVADSSIQSEDIRDNSYYYGVRTETRFTCSRCGVVDGMPDLLDVWQIA